MAARNLGLALNGLKSAMRGGAMSPDDPEANPYASLQGNDLQQAGIDALNARMPGEIEQRRQIQTAVHDPHADINAANDAIMGSSDRNPGWSGFFGLVGGKRVQGDVGAPTRGVPAMAGIAGRTAQRGGGRNDFFDSEYTPDPAAQLSDLMEAQDGLNPTGRHELALAGLNNTLDNYRTSQGMNRQRLQEMDPNYRRDQAREDAMTTNDLNNEFAPDLNTRVRNAAMSGAQTASDTYFLPGQTAMRNNANAAALERVRVPAEMKMQGDIAGHELDLEGKMAEAAGRAGEVDQKNNSSFMDMYGKSMGQNMNPTDEQKVMLEAIMRQLMQKMHYQVPAAGAPAGR